ncbi:hypothetical protein ACFL5P_00420 [candidate division KSB1 bacterium]
MPYLYNFEKIKTRTISNFKKSLEKSNGILVADLKVSDLIFHNKKAISTGHGIYIFKSSDEFLYVGKSSSRSFIERVPSHFDIRENSWFNTYLNRIIEFEYATDLEDAARFALNTYLLIINFEEQANLEKHCSLLEKLLRGVLEPKFNMLSKRQQKKFENTVDLDYSIIENINALQE